MDNNIPQPASEQKYQPLGRKVLWLFFLQISPVAFILLVLSAFLFVLSSQPFLMDTVFGNMQKYAVEGTLITFLAALLIIIGSFIFAWLTYINYLFMMADDSFKIKRGILSKKENAIPYRQIQNVDIERTLLFQILGLSRVIILTAGHEDNAMKGAASEAEGIIPAIDKKLAEWLQTELLKKADVQKVTETKQDGVAGKN